jgi:hypothetical protein
MAPRLERLSLNLENREEAVALGFPDVFARLTRLDVTLPDQPGVAMARALETLANAPFIPRLESFTLTPPLNWIPRNVEQALLGLLETLKPERVRRIYLRQLPESYPAVAGMLAARFGEKVSRE